MRGKRRGENDRAQARSAKIKDLWGARPMSGHPKTSDNKRLARKLERRLMRRSILREV